MDQVRVGVVMDRDPNGSSQNDRALKNLFQKNRYSA
jgi:hypothetical protein